MFTTSCKRLAAHSLAAAIWSLTIVLLAFANDTRASVSHLQVEYRTTPIGIDTRIPRFSWRHEATAADIRGIEQTTYQIVVKDALDQVVWDSGKVVDPHSVNIPYSGPALQPATRYKWTLTVWDNHAAVSSASSWFETGLMNPDPKLAAWDGASWIGGGDGDLVLYSPYLSVFDLAYTLTIAPGSRRTAVVFGANDPRLMDANKNIYQLHNNRNESYVKVELDVGAVGDPHDGVAHLNIYRAGYSKTDVASRPLQSYPISAEVISPANAHEPHRIEMRDELGELSFRIDGHDAFVAGYTSTAAGPQSGNGGTARVNLNPSARGGDTLTYGHLCELGFAADPGQTASFSDLVVSNVRAPGNAVFREDLSGEHYAGIYQAFARDLQSGLQIKNGAYVVGGGPHGTFLVADPSHNSMPMLRTTFTVGQQKKLRAARLYITARGIYEAYLNGKRIGEDHYNPGFTQYNRTQLYQSYDVTSMVVPGRNALGAMLGEGWWSGLLGFGTTWNHFGDRQSLLAKLVLDYADGTHEVVTTNDRTWKYFNDGPLVYSSLYMGEIYDAAKEARTEGWSTAEYDDRSWHSAVQVALDHSAFTGHSSDQFGEMAAIDYDRLAIVGQIGEPARIYQVLTARSVKAVRKGVYVYDLGQNVVGVPRVSFSSGQPGRRLTLRVAEMLYPDRPESAGNSGMIMTENYRAALSQDIYVMKSGAQTLQPRFTSHGFRYLELTGVDQPPRPSEVQAVVISSLDHLTASYQTSNSRINRLWSNITWSNIDNFLTVPTDCPQRNERLGWSGDISVFSRTATYLSDAAPFLERHLRAMRDVQLPSGKFTDIAPVGGGLGGVLWGSAGVTVPWELYQQYGDTAVLSEHYSAMAAYIDYLMASIDPDSGLTRDARLGDWLGPQNGQLGSAFPATVYEIYDLWIMRRVAEILGKPADAQKYQALYDSRRDFFNRTFVDAQKKAVGFVMPTDFPGGAMTGEGRYQVADTQSAYAIGLALGAFNDDDTPRMESNLVASVERENRDDGGVLRPKYSLMTGFIGTAWISAALSNAGRTDVAYRLLENSQYPSWLYSVDQGATTIWERLNGYTVENGFGGNNGMNSFNHYAFGAVGQWLLAYSLGIHRDAPGFKSFLLAPEPDPTGHITWAKGHYESVYGTIESGWHVEAGSLTYTATVPANTNATLRLPTRSPAEVREGGKPLTQAAGITFEHFDHGTAVYRLGSGTYRFTAPL